jgi:hypothetical protein
MKKTIHILVLLCLMVSCKQKIQPEDISKINGYWEIEKVILENGNSKEYGVNESFDYFEISKNNSGFRKKVMPQLDGTFLVNDTQEQIKIRLEGNNFYLDYTTPYAKWTEEIITISDNELVFLNKENTEYHYKKANAITILKDDKKVK